MRIARMAVMVWMAGAVAYGRESREKLTVCLRFGLSDRLMIGALAQELAGRMFAAIGVALEWKPGLPAGDSSRQAIIIDAVSDTPADRMPGVLAYATPYEGRHITVFLDRIETIAYPAIVLAHVMVHEITHLLQRTSRHSDFGVMKARWSSGDYSEMRRRPLPFAPEDLDLIYNALPRRLQSNAMAAAGSGDFRKTQLAEGAAGNGSNTPSDDYAK